MHGGVKLSTLVEDILRSSAVYIYREGPIACSVCAPTMIPVEQVADAVNQINPTGIESRWTISDDDHFADGTPHPGPCNLSADRSHYLLHC